MPPENTTETPAPKPAPEPERLDAAAAPDPAAAPAAPAAPSRWLPAAPCRAVFVELRRIIEAHQDEKLRAEGLAMLDVLDAGADPMAVRHVIGADP